MRPLLAFLLIGCGTNVITTDAGTDGATAIDVSGTWHDCHRSLTLHPDGTSEGRSHREGCDRVGTWRTLGSSLIEMTWTGGSCAADGAPSVRRVFLGPGGLVLVDPETAAVVRLADDSTARGLWLLEGSVTGGEPRSTTASVVGNPEDEFGSGCYWSTDGECGGLFSCSGNVLVWETEGTRFSASTSCAGGCPCGSVLEGSVAPDGSLQAIFRGVSCDGSFEGELSATRVAP